MDIPDQWGDCALEHAAPVPAPAPAPAPASSHEIAAGLRALLQAARTMPEGAAAVDAVAEEFAPSLAANPLEQMFNFMENPALTALLTAVFQSGRSSAFMDAAATDALCTATVRHAVSCTGGMLADVLDFDPAGVMPDEGADE